MKENKELTQEDGVISLQGQYGEMTVHTQAPLLESSVAQMYEMLGNPSMEGSTVHIMPDYHAGKGCLIGTTMRLNGKVVPNYVGVDIGCGIMAVELDREPTEQELEQLDANMYKVVPSGMKIWESSKHKLSTDYEVLADKVGIDHDRVRNSIGTLGGGNHFIEIGKTDDGKVYLFIHSGSRGFGARVATYHQKQAEEYQKVLKTNSGQPLSELITSLKAQGRHQEIESTIQAYRKELSKVTIRKEGAYLEGTGYATYLSDLQVAQTYAQLNRQSMVDSISNYLGIGYTLLCDSVHNYIEEKEEGGKKVHILRKGATRADKGELLVIPLNMRDGVILAKGKGNPDWNNSAPHGAGRIYSRSRAKAELTLTEFERSMAGVLTTSVTQSTLDESPMAYKPKEEILGTIGASVDILTVIKPIYNFKAQE